MCLRFVFLLITWVISWLRLSQREEARQTAEILILRHQLAVLQRRPPPPEPELGGRALLATLVGVMPKARRRGFRLPVAAETILRWHRDIVCRRWPTPALIPRLTVRGRSTPLTLMSHPNRAR